MVGPLDRATHYSGGAVEGEDVAHDSNTVPGDDAGTGRRAVRPAFLVVLGVVVLAVVGGVSYLLGHRAGQLGLTAADRAYLDQVQELAEQRPSVTLMLESDDERTTLAFFLQQSIAGDLSAYSDALLIAAGEDPPTGGVDSGVFGQSNSPSLTASERDELFRSGCLTWTSQVQQLTAPQQLDGLSPRLRELFEVFGDDARQLGDLCAET